MRFVSTLIAAYFVLFSSKPIFADSLKDLIAHDTDSMLVGVGYGSQGRQLNLMLRVWGLELGVGKETSRAKKTAGIFNDPTDDPLATSNNFFLGISPLSLGSWFKNKDHCTDVNSLKCTDFTFSQPYVRLNLANVYLGDVRSRDFSVVIGTRATVTSPLRIGVYAETSLGNYAESSRVTAGFLIGVGSYHPDNLKNEWKVPSAVKTVVGFCATALFLTGVGVVYGFLRSECEMNDC